MKIIFLLICLFSKILFIKSTAEEPIISHDILRLHAFRNAPKYWFAFLKKFLYNTIKKDDHQIGTKFLAKKAKHFWMKAKRARILVPSCDDYKRKKKCYLKESHPGQEMKNHGLRQILRNSG